MTVGTAYSQEPENTFTIDAQVLVRGEIRRGGMPVDEDTEAEVRTKKYKANFISERTRLSVGIDKKWLSAKITAQHSGIWGDATRGTLGIYEAWGLLKANNGLFLKFGRQGLAYDDERIIGTNDWSVAASSHDALKFGYEGHNHKVHAIFAYNQNARNIVVGETDYYDGSQPHKSLMTLWYHYDFPKFPLGVSVIGMNVGMQGDKDVTTGDRVGVTRYQQLVGSYVKYQPAPFTVEGSYYRQMGHNEENMKIDAWMASIKAKFAPTWTYDISAGYDYMSGDKYFAVPPQGMLGVIHHDVVRGFNPIYGSHHEFYGAMDFFYVSTFINGFTPGLQNLYVAGSYSPMKNLKFDAAYHHFAITANLSDVPSKNLGDEIEIEGSYSFLKEAKLSAGFSFMKGTETMEFLKRATGNRHLRWLWMSISVSPSVFTTKW